jgi:hypothetical protein
MPIHKSNYKEGSNMSTEVTYSRKATFIKSENGEYIARNKRAKTVVRKAGKRKCVSHAQLAKLVGVGTYKFYVVTARMHKDGKTPVLMPIKF